MNPATKQVRITYRIEVRGPIPPDLSEKISALHAKALLDMKTFAPRLPARDGDS